MSRSLRTPNWPFGSISRRRCCVVLLLVVCLLVATVTATAETETSEQEQPDPAAAAAAAETTATTTVTTTTEETKTEGTASSLYEDAEYKCDLYVAESSIPAAGWGIYTGRSLKENEPIVPFDVAIHVMDYDYNYVQTLKQEAAVKKNSLSAATAQEDQDAAANLINIEDFDGLPDWALFDYTWQAAVTWHELDANQVEALLPGVGMLVNSFPQVANLELEGCNDQSGGGWSNPVLAGSHSDCQQAVFSTNQRLPAGHELFVDYGDSWFISYQKENLDETDQDVALTEDYEAIDALLMEWESLMSGDLDSPEAAAAYHTLRDAVTKPSQRRLLPRDASKAATLLVYKYHHTANTPYFPLQAAHSQLRSSGIRSADWLNRNGMCIDGIITRNKELPKTLLPETTTVTDNSNPAAASSPEEDDDDSTLYGAFSKRAVAKGDVVMPVPVMHLSRSHLTIHNAPGFDNNTQQLLLNYCFGDDESSLLLFPYAPGINLIHHHGSAPNVAIRWASKETNPLKSTNEKWLSWTVEQVLEMNDEYQSRHLLLELYALRDIAEGEELFLDYGSSWVQAWDQHVAAVAQQEQDNKDLATTTRFPPAGYYDQSDEIYTLTQDPEYYPHHVQVRCWVDRELLDPPDEVELLQQDTDEEVDHDENDNEDDDEESHDKDSWYTWWNPDMDESLAASEPCLVLAADLYKSRKDSYRVILEADQLHVKNVPWYAITFVEYPYHSVQFSPTAFRHARGVPANLYPEQWKDLKQTNKDNEQQPAVEEPLQEQEPNKET